MDKVIPILPCPDIKTQVEFYQQLGFEVTGLYTSPNPYASIRLGPIELHFWGSRKNVPAENPSMCFIQVEDVDTIYDAFVSRLKESTGKVPRSGIPKISKVRDLVNDRRFTLTDPGGNTIFIGKPVASGTHNFFRTLENEKNAKNFTVLYDVVYSKEDPTLAASTLPKYGIDKNALNDLDKAKFLLVTLEIQRALGQSMDDEELKHLLESHQNENEDWERIKNKHSNIMQQD
jgi:hypothetical protein